ncbi:chemotaxis response regulator protein-glutamate methylesterase [Cytophagales bacterium LB-30]|uniref:Protein-glutamate methylesterase/protein-glutamine glutaminase n=1 Tax=Shiella aurantiaca TaxID=3058365 RepID=A0ABT8F6X2_9BACT|nr:chemotaxis response regulator protein-glutamate methylesterase [Shiella aurantiaca]MDN4166130.1 chemotaxis response regulator protein-glutamate methylesterase [Shiella aurantiaca]
MPTSTPYRDKIQVMVIDDSALVRKVLGDYINQQSDMQVTAVAADPYIAVQKLKARKPDVITLDVEMPRMDGLTFLKKLMAQHPIPVIIVSSLTKKGGEIALRGLEYGAVDFFPKEDMRVVSNQPEEYEHLLDKIRAASKAKPKRLVQAQDIFSRPVPNELATVYTTEKVIAIGASAGGTEALKEVLMQMPINCPGMVIVQHMPPVYTKSFAERLNELCAITVKEAEHNDTIIPGRALIAPGDKHMRIKRSGAVAQVELWDGPLVNRHKPAVDVLFHSAAEQLGKNALGVILTGMGADGAQGLKAMREKGAITIAQDEQSSVVYGMPKEAAKIGAAKHILPLSRIAHELVTLSATI